MTLGWSFSAGFLPIFFSMFYVGNLQKDYKIVKINYHNMKDFLMFQIYGRFLMKNRLIFLGIINLFTYITTA